MKILFPTDGSAASITSLSHLVPRLRWFAGTPQVAVLTVHAQLPYARAVAWAGKEAVQKYYEEESGTALAAATALLTKEGVAFEQAMRIGEAAQEIVKFAGEWQADLIAMGTRGHAAIAAALVGSVAQKVIATSTIPVLVIQ